MQSVGLGLSLGVQDLGLHSAGQLQQNMGFGLMVCRVWNLVDLVSARWLEVELLLAIPPHPCTLLQGRMNKSAASLPAGFRV